MESSNDLPQEKLSQKAQEKIKITTQLTNLRLERKKIETEYQTIQDQINAGKYLEEEVDQYKKTYFPQKLNLLNLYMKEENTLLDFLLSGEVRREKHFYDLAFSSQDFKVWIKQQKQFYSSTTKRSTRHSGLTFKSSNKIYQTI